LIEHYCSAKKESYVFWLNQNPNCGDHDCAPIEKESCCSNEETTACCQNFNHFAKLVADYLSTHHDVKHTTCPIFEVEHFNTEYCCSQNYECHFLSDFSDDVGLSKHLQIKQITELLL
jgi:hypothetical protein